MLFLVAPFPRTQGEPDGARSSENRRHRRVKVAAVAVVRPARGPAAVWVVQNLSLGGASFTGGPALAPGQRVEATFFVAGQPPLPLHVRLLRRQVAGSAGRCAVVFEDVTPEQAGAIQAALDAGVERGPGARALVVARRSRVLDGLCAELETLALRPRLVASPFEAAAWIQRDHEAIAVLVEDKLIEFEGWSLPAFLREVRPATRRIAIATDVHTFRLDMALRSGLLDALVERPFGAAALAARLGIEPAAGTRRRPRRAG